MIRRYALDRRTLIATLAAGFAVPARAETRKDMTLRIWPGPMPGAGEVAVTESFTDDRKKPDQPNRSITGVTVPELAIRYPENPNGAAMLILPGGGFRNLAYDKEGAEVADWLVKLGFVTGVLKYRLPRDGWKSGIDVAVQDCQRAMRLLRQQVGGGKTGVMGFSAGGYLGAALATRFTERLDGQVDAADGQSARPDFAALIYPGFGAQGTQIPPLADKVTKETSPVFIVHAADDSKAPAAGSLGAATVLMKLKVPVELHMFQTGEHGFALRRTAADAWPPLFERWVRQQMAG